MVLVTGPTGSGKTTTLYAALNEIKTDEDKLITIEEGDAILDVSNPKLPCAANWPEADFIIGNPPFLGGSCSVSTLVITARS